MTGPYKGAGRELVCLSNGDERLRHERDILETVMLLAKQPSQRDARSWMDKVQVIQMICCVSLSNTNHLRDSEETLRQRLSKFSGTVHGNCSTF